MKARIGSCLAKTALPTLLREVRAGKSFTITSRGEPIADLVPAARKTNVERAAAVERIKAFMKADPVRGVTLRELMDEGRT